MHELQGRHRRVIRNSIATVLLSAALVVPMLGADSANAEVASGSGHGCWPSSGPVTVHFELGAQPGVAGVVLQGFDPHTCDGQPVTVTLSGNQAGDPNAPVTELLSTLDSSRDACTGAKLHQPAVIDGGTIELTGCASTTDPQEGAYADLHDLTQLSVAVSGQEVPSQPGTVILGEQATRPRANGGSGAAQVLGIQATRPRGGISGVLASTGGPQPLMFWGGLLILLFGVGSILLDRVTGLREAFATQKRDDREE